MYSLNKSVEFFINLIKIEGVVDRKLDSGLGGLGFKEFIILYHLMSAEKNTLRRIDLAEKIGLTASGVTRLLLPMEKIGLVKSGGNEGDARIKSVMIAKGGEIKFSEAIERAELVVGEFLEKAGVKISGSTFKEIEVFAKRV